MRLIDADALIGELHTQFFYDGRDRTRVYAKIQDQQTVEPEDKCGECDAWNQYKNYPPRPQWIPCRERLPDGRLNKSYLVQDKDGRRAVGTYTNWGWMFGHYMNDPVAWMPLPEPYTEGNT